MKRSLFPIFFLAFVMSLTQVKAQAPHLFEYTYPVIHEEQPQIRTLMEKVSIDSLEASIDHLQSYHTRRWDSKMVYEVQDWLKNTYASWGFDSVYLHDFPVNYHDTLYETSDNVIVIQRGVRYPDEYVVCGAHYDSYNNSPGDPDSLRAPGADDNASGTAGILETARLLSQCSFERSVIYCGFAAEEIGLIGSTAYAKDCAEQRLPIVAYFNLDMIGYLEEGSDIHVNLLYTGQDSTLANYVYSFCHVYYPEMRVWQDWLAGGSDSDYSSFNRNGYAAIQPFEDTHHSSPFIHTPQDIIGVSVNNMDQVKRFTELNLGLVATLAGLVSSNVDEQEDDGLMVYPNPASESIIVKGMPIREIRLYNRLGQEIVSRSYEGAEECRVELGSLVPGLYLVQVLAEDGRLIVKKFVKE